MINKAEIQRLERTLANMACQLHEVHEQLESERETVIAKNSTIQFCKTRIKNLEGFLERSVVSAKRWEERVERRQDLIDIATKVFLAQRVKIEELEIQLSVLMNDLAETEEE